MNDIFYFAEKEIDAKDLFLVLNDEGRYNVLLSEDNNALQVSLSESIIAQIACMEIEKDFGDQDDIEVIESSGVKSSFCVSHHSKSFPYIKVLLEFFLKNFGGWAGNDSNAFEPRFVLTDIALFEYSVT